VKLDIVFQFLQAYEIWIYAILGVISLFYLRKLWLGLREWRGSLFGFEREVAQPRFSAALTGLVLLALIGIGEFSIVTFVIPSVPKTTILPTATINPVQRITSTLGVSSITITPIVTVVTKVPTSSVNGCIPNQIEWTFPKAGGLLKGTVELRGTVDVPNLGFFKYEYSKMGSDTWVTIAAGNEKKVDKPLAGLWNTGQLATGDYLLRLVVADNQNKLLPACIIQVRIIAP
jgi:hypothetical protein